MRLVAFLASLARPAKGLAVLGLAFYGAWSIYQPAGYLVAAFLLLIELATDRPT